MMSLIQILHNNGPTFEPCGTPVVINCIENLLYLSSHTAIESNMQQRNIYNWYITILEAIYIGMTTGEG